MKLVTIAYEGGTRVARVEEDNLLELDAPDLACLLTQDTPADELPVVSQVPLESVRLLAPVSSRTKFFCVGLNYYSHMEEAGLPKPEYPIIFSKFPSVLIGPGDDILMPNSSNMMDWEVELGVVIGERVREVDEEEAVPAIAGFTVSNDVTARDWQLHTSQWVPGKNVGSSTPVGPWMVSVDELGPDPDLRITTHVDGQLRQNGRTSDQIFTPAQIISYISGFITLEPGDIISTGTCAGVGHIMNPPVYLNPHETVETYIEGIGTLTNRCVGDRAVAAYAKAPAWHVW